MTLTFLAIMPFDDNVSAHLLEVKGTLFHLGMKLAVDEDTRVEILLRESAEFLIFAHNALVHCVYGLKIFVGRVSVAIDFVVDVGCSGGSGHEFLHEEEVGALNDVSTAMSFQGTRW